jgi:acyl dehydratase
VARAVDRDPTALQYLDARLSAPVYPGATLDVEAWTQGPGFAYRASVAWSGPVLTGNGTFAG